MRRTLYAVVTQAARGASFTAQIPETPRPGTQWIITRMTVDVPNYVSGALNARMYVDGRFIAGTNQGQNDVYQGGTEVVHPAQVVTVTWDPTAVPNIVQGRVIMEVDQMNGQGPRGVR